MWWWIATAMAGGPQISLSGYAVTPAGNAPLVRPHDALGPHGIPLQVIDDLDLDGSSDVVLWSAPTGTSQAKLSLYTTPFTDQGAGVPVATLTVPGVRQRGGDTAVGDFDGDGLPDLAVMVAETDLAEGGIAVFRGPVTGTLTLQDAWSVITASGHDSIVGGIARLADTDGDGRDELVGQGESLSNTFVFVSRPATGSLDLRDDATLLITSSGAGGTAGLPWQRNADLVSARPWVGDVDGDGLPDLVLSGRSQSLRCGTIYGTWGNMEFGYQPAAAVSIVPDIGARIATATTTARPQIFLEDVSTRAFPIACDTAGSLQILDVLDIDGDQDDEVVFVMAGGPLPNTPHDTPTPFDLRVMRGGDVLVPRAEMYMLHRAFGWRFELAADRRLHTGTTFQDTTGTWIAAGHCEYTTAPSACALLAQNVPLPLPGAGPVVGPAQQPALWTRPFVRDVGYAISRADLDLDGTDELVVYGIDPVTGRPGALTY